ncbi:hypothetical protein CONPUDRAFT_164020 [Coniophora puteana RWD-64-598 SS2]|uniref:Uncharacterized protein n=1 Tax=Coniophora puteana (strain RWD-64-598) TaxID=741705 RepID=A0A5M3MV56_CONPW|nr:uncharacterized protein CONPUDRAFT_164020 [Coniophora puteana RWD-64-598 SS2]EIW83003.1 hypothetical protein CONPUDRAFT_164020 [Coniophora puteana RWD-64-598 SS2]
MTELTTPVSTPRLVPGAPPLGSTSQRKKRKTTKSKAVDSPIEPPVAIPDSTAAALVERAPDATDIQEGSVAPELVVQPENESVTDDNSPKPSPVAELIQKRTKALGKKITRISSYASIEYEKLNDDQKRTLKTLPALEAVHKELDDVKKAIEAHEADYGRELALQKAEAKRAEQARISEAISVTKASCIDGTLSIFSLIRLRSSLATGAISSALDFNDIEGSAIFGVTDTLLGVDSEAKRDVVDGLMSGEGSFNEVAYARILDIVSSFLHPVREPSPLPTDAESIHEGDAAVLAPGTPPISMTAAGAPTNGSSGFHFMQASELDGPSFESAELVEKPSTSTEANSLESQVEDVAVTDPSIDVPSNGQPADTPAPNGALDWADEEGGLPSIATLQATFAPSGAATPLAENIGSEVTATVSTEVVAGVEGDSEENEVGDGVSSEENVVGGEANSGENEAWVVVEALADLMVTGGHRQMTITGVAEDEDVVVTERTEENEDVVVTEATEENEENEEIEETEATEAKEANEETEATEADEASEVDEVDEANEVIEEIEETEEDSRSDARLHLRESDVDEWLSSVGAKAQNYLVTSVFSTVASVPISCSA